MSDSLLPFLSVSGFLLSWLTVALLERRFQEQFLDIPNERSAHTIPTPRGGGLGFVVAFAMTSAAGAFFLSPSLPLLPLWLTILPLAAIGIADDRRGLPASLRYLVQLSASSIAVFSLGAFPQPWLVPLGNVGSFVAIALTVIGMTAIINFYNFMDGLDGLVAGCSAVQFGFLALYLHQPLLWPLVAALAGFLLWNWSPAKIFMGDVGSTTLGAIVAFALLSGDREPVRAWSALAIALPLLGDAIYTLVRRLINRENIFQAHRSHLYQRLQRSGWTHSRVAWTYIGFTLAIAISLYFLGSFGAIVSLLATLGALAIGERQLTVTTRDDG